MRKNVFMHIFCFRKRLNLFLATFCMIFIFFDASFFTICLRDFASGSFLWYSKHTLIYSGTKKEAGDALHRLQLPFFFYHLRFLTPQQGSCRPASAWQKSPLHNTGATKTMYCKPKDTAAFPAPVQWPGKTVDTPIRRKRGTLSTR